MNVSVPVPMLDRIDEEADRLNVTRAEVVRALVTFALDGGALVGDRDQLALDGVEPTAATP